MSISYQLGWQAKHRGQADFRGSAPASSMSGTVMPHIRGGQPHPQASATLSASPQMPTEGPPLRVPTASCPFQQGQPGLELGTGIFVAQRARSREEGGARHVAVGQVRREELTTLQKCSQWPRARIICVFQKKSLEAGNNTRSFP